MKKLVAGLAIVILLLVAVGCSQASNPSRNTAQGAFTAPATSTASGAAPPAKFLDPNSGIYFNTAQELQSYESAHAGIAGSPSTANLPSSDRMVVRTGNLDLVVSDVSSALDNISKIAADFGGYVVTSQKSKQGERLIGNISIRVLAENYDKAVVALRGLSMDIINETSSSQDVTQEYTDLGSQVKNLEATESQLLKIMASATKTEDVLAVQQQLTTVQGQIEQDKGRMQYLERTSATSLIQISLKEAVIEVKFNADKINVDADQSVHFISQINGGFTPYNYQWDFGDGKTSTDQSPAHSYANTGIYAVTLKVTDDKGYTNSLNRDAYITVIGNWNPGGIARSAWAGFTGFGRVFIGIVIWLGIFSPVWIIIGGIILWTTRRKRRKV